MSRLYDVDIDEIRWNLIEADNSNYHTYKLIDKENRDTYFFKNIIGMEQVEENEFLVYKRYNINEFMISRYLLKNSEYNILFEKKFNHFYFVTDDRILFTYCGNDARYRSLGIYSISENNYVEDSKWLDGRIIEIYSNSNEVKLVVEIDNYSSVLGDNKLIFTVNPETLEPNSPCYSTIRDSFIKVKSKEDIMKIKSDDTRYIDIIANYYSKQAQENIKNAKEKILLKNT